MPNTPPQGYRPRRRPGPPLTAHGRRRALALALLFALTLLAVAVCAVVTEERRADRPDPVPLDSLPR